jgi:hypothetical protein
MPQTLETMGVSVTNVGIQPFQHDENPLAILPLWAGCQGDRDLSRDRFGCMRF